LASGEKELQ
jgi:hypothetical protein